MKVYKICKVKILRIYKEEVTIKDDLKIFIKVSNVYIKGNTGAPINLFNEI